MAESTKPETVPPTPWVSVPAVRWALDEAPVPGELLATLIAIARFAGEDGRGARPSAGRVAHSTGKSVDQVRNDITRLRGLGLLLLGDQELAGHLPPGQRPVVYDIPLTVRGPKPGRTPRNKQGRNGRAAQTPGTDATPGTDTGGSAEDPLYGYQGTPCMDTGSTPCMETGTPPVRVPPEEPKNKPDEESSSILPGPARPRSAPPAPERALTGAEDEDEDDDKAEPEATPGPAERSLGALLDGIMLGRRRHLQPANLPHRVKERCTYPGCVAGAVLVPVSAEHPSGARYCPECMVVPAA